MFKMGTTRGSQALRMSDRGWRTLLPHIENCKKQDEWSGQRWLQPGLRRTEETTAVARRTTPLRALSCQY